MKQVNRSIFSILIFGCLASSASAGQSVWDHNGSQMLLQSNGSERTITYLYPRPGINAQAGQVLFQGRRVGNSYEGTAYTFRAGCQPASYFVGGPLGSETKIILSGSSPIRTGCQVTGYNDQANSAQLIFTYLKKYDGQPPAQPPLGQQSEGPREGPVENIVKNIPGGKVTIRIQDEDAPAETPIRVDVTAQCVSGRTVNVLVNHRTCNFLGIRTLQDGSGFDLQELKFGGSTCSVPDTSRVQTYDLCQ